MIANTQLINVVILGTAFHLIFFSFQTSVFIQQTVINSLNVQCNRTEATTPTSVSKQQRHTTCDFSADAYIGLCITYAVFALTNWLAPSVLALIGCKLGMLIGSATYIFYAASFVQPTTVLFYASATLIGAGAAILWTAQGSFLSANSSPQTSSRNASIFWSLLQSSLLFGNLFVYIAFSSQETISNSIRQTVYTVLASVCLLGAILLSLLRHNNNNNNIIPTADEDFLGKPPGPLAAAVDQFVAAVKLAKSIEMILLASAFLFTGQLLTFFTGIYGTAIGATPAFGANAKQFIGLSGIFIGVGELIGGFVFGLGTVFFSKCCRGDKTGDATTTTTSKGFESLPKRLILSLGYVALMAAFALIFVNLPSDSTTGSTAKQHSIIEPSIVLAMFASVLIGFGDACFNTQLYALLMSAYSDDSIGAFALFKFVQSTGAAAAFFYSTQFDLRRQLCLLAAVATLANCCFWTVERRLEQRGRLAPSLSALVGHYASEPLGSADVEQKQRYHHTDVSVDEPNFDEKQV